MVQWQKACMEVSQDINKLHRSFHFQTFPPAQEICRRPPTGLSAQPSALALSAGFDMLLFYVRAGKEERVFMACESVDVSVSTAAEPLMLWWRAFRVPQLKTKGFSAQVQVCRYLFHWHARREHLMFSFFHSKVVFRWMNLRVAPEHCIKKSRSRANNKSPRCGTDEGLSYLNLICSYGTLSAR